MKSARFAMLGLALLARAQDDQPYNFLESQIQPRDTVTTVAAPLSIAYAVCLLPRPFRTNSRDRPSQYWEGNDGPWYFSHLKHASTRRVTDRPRTSYVLRLGQPKGQVVRVFPSTKATHVIVTDDQGCPESWYPSSARDADTVRDCEFSRGGFFMSNESNGWADMSLYSLTFQEVYGHPSNGYFGFDKVGLGYSGSAGTIDHQVIAAVADSNYWFGSLPLNPNPVNFSSIDNPQPSLLQSLKTTRNISSLSWGYTAGAKYRMFNSFCRCERPRQLSPSPTPRYPSS